MTTLVIDTSVIIKWLNQDNEENIDKADKILENVKNGQAGIIAPELAKYEAGNVLLHGKKLRLEQALIALSSLYTLPISFITESKDLAEQTYSLAESLGITYYDAAFLALAKKYEAILVTDNVKHQGKISEVNVLALSNY